MRPERFDVAVVGAGQAGLAAGHFLAAEGRRFVILDAANSVGAAWAKRWASLELFTPRRFDALPGLAFPGEPDGHPSRDEVVSYLNLYAQTFALPMALGTGVWSMTKVAERFVLELDERTIEADAVIVATGPFQTPRVPRCAADLAEEVFQAHSAEYGAPSEIPAGTVLVVGGGNTGFQIASELSATHAVHLSIGSRQTSLPQRFLGRDVFWWLEKTGLLSKSVDTRIGRRLSARDTLIGSSRRALRRQGVAIESRTVGASGRTITFATDAELDVDAVIWATGFGLDHAWIELPIATADGAIGHRRGVTDVPGLYFLGLPWQHTRGSALLGGVKGDAEHITAHIATQFPLPPAGLGDIERDRAGERRDDAGHERGVAARARDQAGRDRDHAAHRRDRTGDQRDGAAEQREGAADDRDEDGARRDLVADQRDVTSGQRDRAGQQRDLAEAQASGPGITSNALVRSALARRDAASDRRAALADRYAAARERTEAERDRDAGASERVEAEHDRDAGASDRVEAEHDRVTARADRAAAARERVAAGYDRALARSDRTAAAKERAASSLDPLTGAYLPAGGFVELDREMARSRRTGQPLTLVAVDVAGLGPVDGAEDRASADRMLAEVAGTVRSSFRPYDLVIRTKPDEFICAITGLEMTAAAKRLAGVDVVLAKARARGWSTTTGLAELQEGDSREDVVARAAVGAAGN
ncbi:MAG: NAD(P)-binding domain-containing protein [Solirubrobacteraceae bacterium]